MENLRRLLVSSSYVGWAVVLLPPTCFVAYFESMTPMQGETQKEYQQEQNVDDDLYGMEYGKLLLVVGEHVEKCLQFDWRLLNL